MQYIANGIIEIIFFITISGNKIPLDAFDDFVTGVTENGGNVREAMYDMARKNGKYTTFYNTQAHAYPKP